MRSERMTLDEIIAAKNKDVLTAIEVSGALGCRAESIRLQAQADAKKLGFPVIVMNSEVRIPRKAFLRFMGVEDEAVNA